MHHFLHLLLHLHPLRPRLCPALPPFPVIMNFTQPFGTFLSKLNARVGNFPRGQPRGVSSRSTTSSHCTSRSRTPRPTPTVVPGKFMTALPPTIRG
eukprot:1131793-Pyramimonas_sp.AAC.1